MLSCSESDNNDIGFIDSATNQFLSFVNDVEEESDSINIIVEEIENAIDHTEEDTIRTFSRIIIIRNEEELQTLQVHLNIGEDGNTIDITSISFQFFLNDELNTYWYLREEDNEVSNPQSLTYTITESTNTNLNINISGILSNYNIESDLYQSLTFSDIDLDISF